MKVVNMRSIILGEALSTSIVHSRYFTKSDETVGSDEAENTLAGRHSGGPAYVWSKNIVESPKCTLPLTAVRSRCTISNGKRRLLKSLLVTRLPRRSWTVRRLRSEAICERGDLIGSSTRRTPYDYSMAIYGHASPRQ